MLKQSKAKFFIGCLLTPQLRMHIGDGDKWLTDSQAKRVEHQGQTYLGFSIDQPKTIAEIRLIQDEMQKQLKELYPVIDPQKLTIKIFPQIFTF